MVDLRKPEQPTGDDSFCWPCFLAGFLVLVFIGSWFWLLIDALASPSEAKVEPKCYVAILDCPEGVRVYKYGDDDVCKYVKTEIY